MKNGSYVEIACYDWSDKITKEKNYHDHLKVALITNEFGLDKDRLLVTVFDHKWSQF